MKVQLPARFSSSAQATRTSSWCWVCLAWGFFLLWSSQGCNSDAGSAGTSTASNRPLPDVGESLSATVRDVLEAPDSMMLYALEPDERRGAKAQTVFHGFEILGEAPTDQGHELISLIYRGIVESDGMVARCFNPRHGLRATRGGQSVDLLICYECLSMRVIGPGESNESALTADGVAKSVTEIYEKHGLTIAN